MVSLNNGGRQAVVAVAGNGHLPGRAGRYWPERYLAANFGRS